VPQGFVGPSIPFQLTRRNGAHAGFCSILPLTSPFSLRRRLPPSVCRGEIPARTGVLCFEFNESRHPVAVSPPHLSQTAGGTPLGSHDRRTPNHLTQERLDFPGPPGAASAMKSQPASSANGFPALTAANPSSRFAGPRLLRQDPLRLSGRTGSYNKAFTTSDQPRRPTNVSFGTFLARPGNHAAGCGLQQNFFKC